MSTRVHLCEDYAEKLYVFRDRIDAGRKLGEWLKSFGVSIDVVFAVPAGGVPVGFEVARILGAKLDVVVCRKILIPWNREAGFGAVAPDGSIFVDRDLAEALGLTTTDIETAIREQLDEIRRRLRVFRCDEPYPPLDGLTVAIVDDGIAAGYTMLAASTFLRKLKPKKLVVAVPTCHRESLTRLIKTGLVDEVYCLNARSGIVYAVADAYVEWRDLTDHDVLELLRRARDSNMLNFRGSCF